jgi:hypothetical protein
MKSSNAIADPKREKLRRANDEPSETTSSSDRDEPNRPSPQIARAEPIRANDRNANDDPRCKKSSTATVDAKRA